MLADGVRPLEAAAGAPVVDADLGRAVEQAYEAPLEFVERQELVVHGNDASEYTVTKTKSTLERLRQPMGQARPDARL